MRVFSTVAQARDRLVLPRTPESGPYTRPVIPPLTAAGVLPRGRFPATITEVERAFVTDPRWTASTTRPVVWADWQQITAQVRKIVPVAAVWLGGSFLTGRWTRTTSTSCTSSTRGRLRP